MMARMSFGPLVDSAWLGRHLADPDLCVVDCRWRLGQPGEGELEWQAGHIPGAAFLDLDRDLSSPPGAGGRHPLPSGSQFEAAARRAGISAGTRAVVYDEALDGGATRLWWLLRHHGHDEVAVLDGGLAAWRAGGGPLRAGPEQIEPGSFESRVRGDDTAGADELAGRLDDERLALLDARAAARYAGLEEPIDPVAGHIPGALNTPFAELVPDGRFLAPEELAERLRPAGERELVAYCGSGVTACTVVLAATLAGRGARLYPGSWSEWCELGLPVARSGEGGEEVRRSP
jgi:thiosulfate/3-mercaptopyruvate sulfurtransferase